MYTVLIADKKKQMFHVYKHMLHWDKYNFEVISFAETLDDAISYYREYHHDLVISDTELKDGSGIDLLLQLKTLDKHCHMILCSYDTTYETMRQALRNGCMDYLNKATFKNIDMIENLEWISDTYKQKYDVVNHDWQEALQRILGLIRDKQAFQFDELYHLLKREELKILTLPYRMLYFRLDDVKESVWQHHFENRNELKELLNDAIDTLMQEYPNIHVTLFSKMHAGIILLEDCAYIQLATLANNLIKHLKEMYAVSISIYISTQCKGYEMFYDSYVSYCDALPCRFYLGNESIVSMEQLPIYQPISLFQFTYKETILHLFDKCNFKEIIPYMKTMFLDMKSLAILPEDVLQYCRVLIHSIERQELKKGISKNQALFDQFPTVFIRMETLSLLESYMLTMMQEIITWITTSSKFLYSDIMIEIIQYVDTHLYEKISLQDISDSIHRTPIHISRIFKQQMKENLMYYINRCKMEKAAVLLIEQKKMKVKEIAEKIGIHDQLYFNKVFRKYYHVSPREYRKNQ